MIDISINRPHIKSTVYLPLWIRRVTGIMFFPVIAPPPDGIPDGNPLGVAGLSLENEKLNVVTGFKIYKKTPVFYESADYKTAEGEVFLDRGYSRHDFIECNDPVSANSFLVFKYTNRKMVIAGNSIEWFNLDYKRLQSLVGGDIKYEGSYVTLQGLETAGDIIRLLTGRMHHTIEIHKDNLRQAIHRFIDPQTGEPFFTGESPGQEYDQAFTMKLILRCHDQ